MVHLDNDVFVFGLFIDENLEELVHVQLRSDTVLHLIAVLVLNISKINCDVGSTILVLIQLRRQTCLSIDSNYGVHTLDVFFSSLEAPQLGRRVGLLAETRLQLCRGPVIEEAIAIVAFGLRVSHAQVELEAFVYVDRNETGDLCSELPWRCSSALAEVHSHD